MVTALALLSQGAQGNTFDQIVHGIHLEANKMAIANGFATLNKLLSENAGQSTLSIANRLYVHQDYQIQQSFHDVAVNKFESGIETINFANYAAAARTINSFVAQKTNNKIKDLFEPSPDLANTALIIVNAIYFKGNWKSKFSQSNTSPDDFYVEAMKIITVDFMHKTDYHYYAQFNNLKASALELEYDKSNISFIAVLPNSRTGLSELEASLVNYDLSKITKQMYAQEVDIKLPKFKIEYEIELTQVLQKVSK